MKVEQAGGLADVAVAAEKAFKRFDKRAIVALVVLEQWAKRFLVEVGEFALPVEVEEQTVDAQASERVDFSITEEAAPDL